MIKDVIVVLKQLLRNRKSSSMCMETFTGEEFLNCVLVQTIDSVFGVSTLMNRMERGLHVFYQGR